MKIKVKKEVILDGLQKVQSVINPRNTLPVLANVLFEAEEGQFHLTATDMNLTLRARIEAEVREPGLTTLPAKRLSGVIRELNVDEFELDVDENDIAHFQSGNSEFHIHGISAADFPALPEMESPKVYTVDQPVFREMIRLTSYAASLDPHRQVLNGIYLTFKNGKIGVVGTDSRRLALVEEEAEFPADAEAEFIVPLKTAEELLRTLGSSGSLRIQAAGGQLAFEYDGMLVISQLIEGPFPNFRQVIPSSSAHRVVLSREDFLTALRRTSQLILDVGSGIKLTFTKNRLEIHATASEIGEARETMAVKYKGPDLAISFNPVFLMDPLKVLTTDEVFLDITDDTSPGVLRSKTPLVYILMPIRIS